MLSVNSYDKGYVDDCRAKVELLLSTYRNLAAAATSQSAIEAFEPHLFTHMILALTDYFCHRARGMEGKDGNPLNEVRILADSIMSPDGKFRADKAIKYDPAKSVLNYKAGDRVSLNAADFARLSKAFFDEVERKYPQPVLA